MKEKRDKTSKFISSFIIVFVLLTVFVFVVGFILLVIGYLSTLMGLQTDWMFTIIGLISFLAAIAFTLSE